LRNTGQNGGIAGIDIKICDAWTITRGSGIKVAVVDTPIDINHNDLSSNIISVFDTQNGTSPHTPTTRPHGTHVAGTVASVRNNNLQVAGVAPESKILGVSQDLMAGNSNISAQLASGISWAWRSIANGGAEADVINNSWGDPAGNNGQLFSTVLNNAIIDAITFGRNGKGCVVVFASGNSSVINYPAYIHNDILVVGSINSSGIRASNSGFGAQLDVVAPGVSILSTYPNNSTETANGTSMADPHIAGVAALILSVNPNLTQKQVADIIEQTAQEVGGYTYSTTSGRPNGTWNNQMGYGLVNAHASVKQALCSLSNITFSKTVTTNENVYGNSVTVQNTTVNTGRVLKITACNNITTNNNVNVNSGAT